MLAATSLARRTAQQVLLKRTITGGPVPHRTGSEPTLVEKSALLIAPGLSVVLLAGCSGGGGASAPPVFPGEAAMNAYLQSAHHSTLYATVSAGST